MAHMTPQEWNQHYVDGQLPWDSGVPSKELIRVLGEAAIKPCRAAELGCGTGTPAAPTAAEGGGLHAFDAGESGIGKTELLCTSTR